MNPVNDIFGQARQGSVAAIIQILNERLLGDGIRTRAVFADGILQLLCEAPTVEQLDRAFVVERIKRELEVISPRRIRKVNVNSRTVREQQLLWLEEINRDPERQILWSELITLKQPPLLQRLWQDLRQRKPRSEFPAIPSAADLKQRKSFVSGMTGGVGVVCLLLLVGWAFRERLGVTTTAGPSEPIAALEPAPATSPAQAVPVADSVPIPEESDAFAKAVRLAEAAAAEGQTAQTPAQWLEIAARWQQASDLMAEVPSGDSRYRLAQDRVQAYQRYSETALKNAER